MLTSSLSKSNMSLFSLQSFRVGDDLLVEARFTRLLWDASILSLSKPVGTVTGDAPCANAYRVQYKNWGVRFTEWVTPDRIVEPDEKNRIIQVSTSIRLLSALLGLTHQFVLPF